MAPVTSSNKKLLEPQLTQQKASSASTDRHPFEHSDSGSLVDALQAMARRKETRSDELQEIPVLVETSATLVVTSALLVVTRSY